MARVYCFGEYELDLTAEELRRNGSRLPINRRMFQVLLLLLERSGEIVTKDEFFEKVWDGQFVEDNNLTVTITALRRVLNDDAKSARFIENLPRKGYRFIAPVEVAGDPARSETAPAKAAGSRTAFFERRLSFAVLAVFIVVALAIAGLASRRFWLSRTPVTTSNAVSGIDSIAVLPFAIDGAENEYLADGLTDAVIADLSLLPQLRVIDRNSSFQFKNNLQDVTEAARRLSVRAIATGRVEKRADVIVVDVVLFDIDAGSQIWRQQFDRRTDELVQIQHDISQAMAKNLLAVPGGRSRGRLSKRLTDDPDAYDLYLKGRYYWNKRSPADILRSIELFRLAIDRDPTFAKAYIGLADAYTLGSVSGISKDEKIALSRGAVRRALEIDDSIGEAYASLAINKCYYDWDFAGADSDYRRATELSPNDATAHHWYAEFLSMQGRFDESFAEYEKALSLDPLSLPIRADMAFARYYARDYDKAIELLSLARQIDPNYHLTYTFLKFAYREKGMFQDAVMAHEQDMRSQYGADARSDTHYNNIMRHIAAIRKEGPNLTAERYWRAELDFEDDPSPFAKAVAHSKLGETDKAFEYLEAAFRGRYSGMVWLKVTPELDGLRADPRYSQLMQRVGFSL